MEKYRYLYRYQLLPGTECHMGSLLVWLNSKVGISKFSLKFTENSPKICYYFEKFFLNIVKFLSANFFHNFSNVSQELCRSILQFLPKFFATNFFSLVISPRLLLNFLGLFRKLSPKSLKYLKNTTKNILLNFFGYLSNFSGKISQIFLKFFDVGIFFIILVWMEIIDTYTYDTTLYQYFPSLGTKL